MPATAASIAAKHAPRRQATARQKKLTLVKPDAAARAALKGGAAPTLPPSRPIVTENSAFLADMDRRARDVEAEINLIDATEARAKADFDERVATERGRFDRWLADQTGKREAEHGGQMTRRGELLSILNGCTAALEASRVDRPADGAEHQERIET